MDELEQKGYIFASIFALANKLQVLGDAFDENITIKQWLFIVSVSKFDSPPTLSEVANFIGYSRQNAKRIAAALNERGYITIIKDQDDARALRISLTQKCTDYFIQRSQKELEFLDDLFNGYDADLTNGVFKGLTRLSENIEMMSNDSIGQ
ncbi:transcriptional regulator, marr family [hydrocarbon metagenome]|uniref:Transcriptional regulator, marr family n=1 Tax=hydrocarbon metagenome TaxID=938273 RepID=A0A0W8E2A5_9ZZZZ